MLTSDTIADALVSDMITGKSSYTLPIMTFSEFVTGMREWLTTQHFIDTVLCGFVQYSRLGTYCKDCNKLDIHDEPIEPEKATDWKDYNCGCARPQKKYKRVSKLK